MRLTIHTDEQVTEAVEWLRRARLAAHGAPLELVVQRARPARSLPQNAKLNALVGELAARCGYETRRELDVYVRAEIYPRKQVVARGRTLDVPKQTDELTAEECSTVIARLEALLAQVAE